MSLDPEENEKNLPPLPSIEKALEALAHAEEVYAETPNLWQKQKETKDVFVDSIMKAIAARG